MYDIETEKVPYEINNQNHSQNDNNELSLHHPNKGLDNFIDSSEKNQTLKNFSNVKLINQEFIISLKFHII